MVMAAAGTFLRLLVPIGGERNTVSFILESSSFRLTAPPIALESNTKQHLQGQLNEDLGE